MMLAELGADVVRVDRAEDAIRGGDRLAKFDLFNRSRRSIAVDLKHPDGVEAVRKMIDRADALIEGFRPGVTERLGLGPDVCLARNPRLIYGRMTGWGQTGPLSAPPASWNYIAITERCTRSGEAASRRSHRSTWSETLAVARSLTVGILAALLEAERSGRGQVVDAAISDGVASLMTLFYGMYAGGNWINQRLQHRRYRRAVR